MVAFLYQRFKRARAISIPHSELLPALVSFREEVQESFPEVLRDRPESYLTDWCEKRWLRRAHEVGRSEPVYQLTPQTEEVIEFLDRALRQDLAFVGTESRLRTIIELLEALVVGSSEDPAVHLSDLRRRQAELEKQIERIERDGIITPYGPTRIREQFAHAVDLLKQLQADFRAVEEKFRQITQQVQQRQVLGMDSRGGILGGALDAEDALKREDQGVSFFAFLSFIQSPQQQDRLHAIIQQLLKIRELAEQIDGLETVRRMVPVLLAEAEKVLQTTRRLSATLRRLLDARLQRERRRVAELLREIQAFAAAMNAGPPRETVRLEVDAEIDLSSPLSRTDWQPPAQFEQIDLRTHVPDSDDGFELFRALAQLRPIDWIAMRRRIHEALCRHERLTLRRLVEEFHPTAAVIDVVGYLETAHEQGHVISREATEHILISPRDGDDRTLLVTVTFVRRVG